MSRERRKSLVGVFFLSSRVSFSQRKGYGVLSFIVKLISLVEDGKEFIMILSVMIGFT